MERLNYYIWIKDNILVNVISATLWFHPAKKYPHKPINPEEWWIENVGDKVVTLGGKEKSYLTGSLLGATVKEKTTPTQTKEIQVIVNLLPMVVLALNIYPVYVCWYVTVAMYSHVSVVVQMKPKVRHRQAFLSQPHWRCPDFVATELETAFLRYKWRLVTVLIDGALQQRRAKIDERHMES